MNKALVKTEHVFLLGYNHFVKEKQSKMQELVDKFKQRNTNISLKDEKIGKFFLSFIIPLPHIDKLEKYISTLK